MSYTFYKWLHITSILAVSFSLGGFWLIASGAITDADRQRSLRKGVSALHGIGLVVALVAGFGLLARLGMMKSMPVWVYGKLGIWLLIGALPAFLRRKPQLRKLFIIASLLLFATAAYLAIYKP